MDIEEQLMELSYYKFNPTALADVLINRITDITDGRVVHVDPNNPFTYILERLALIGSFGIQEDLISDKGLYAVLANSEDDLNRHMSDKDFVGRFSKPAFATLRFTLLYQDIIKHGLTNTETGELFLKIPRNYQLEVDGYYFTLSSPIIIRRTKDGVVDVRFDTSQRDDLFPLETSYINYHMQQIDHNVRYLNFDVRLPEIKLDKENVNIQAGALIEGEFQYDSTRYFYYLKAYYQHPSGEYVEMKVTHTEEVFDIQNPTCSIKVLRDRGVIKYYVPQVYNKDNALGDRLRLVVYTTRGPINVDFGDYLTKPELFSPSYNGISPETDQDILTAPLNNVTKSVYINEKVIGGSPEKSFQKLRQDVINNNLNANLPITSTQIEDRIRDYGLQPVMDYDVVTGRRYLAKAPVPSDVSRYNVARMSLSMMELKTTLSALGNSINNVTKISSEIMVINKGAILEYSSVDGLVILNKKDADRLKGLSGFDLTNEVNNKQYHSTYYHYVLDASTTTTRLRAYELDNPSVLKQYFEDYNNSTQLAANSLFSNIRKTDKGFRIDYNVDIKEFNSQYGIYNVVPVMMIQSKEDDNYFFIEGKLHADIPESPIFTFYLDSDFYIDSQDKIRITNFSGISGVSVDVPLDLTQEVTIIYFTNDRPKDFKRSEMDDVLVGSYLSTRGLGGISKETHTIEFGKRLEHLYTATYSSTGTNTYKTHEEDVPARYTKAVFNSKNEIIHQKDEIMLDIYGDPIIQHRAGDVMFDEEGKTIPIEEAQLNKFLNLLLLDYRFEMANSYLANAYKADVKKNFRTILTLTMSDLHAQLLELTDIKFTVPNKSNEIFVSSDGRRGIIKSQQSFSFDIFVRSRVHSDNDTRKGIESTILSTLDSYLSSNKSYSKADLVSLVKQRVNEFVSSVRLTALSELNSEYLEILDDDAEISIRKKLVMTPDGYDIKDDVEFNFINTDTVKENYQN